MVRNLRRTLNRYSFVWKKTTQKNEAKMQEKMKSVLPTIATELGLCLRVGEKVKAKHLKKLRKQLYALTYEGKSLNLGPWEITKKKKRTIALR